MSETQLIIIVGLPGSGKTYYAKEKFEPLDYKLFDDVGMEHELLRSLIEHLKAGKKAVVTDIYTLTNRERFVVLRRLYMEPELVDMKIDWIFFENDPENCLINIRQRNDSSDQYRTISDDFIFFLSKQYTIPPDQTPRPVYRHAE
jgi:RNase adaptor protein for sRNA GlmZ degradation